MEKKYILALDQGTTSSRAILVDKSGDILGMAQKEFTQIYPKPGWVEHDPMEIWGTQSGVARELIDRLDVDPEEIAAIGIANQRETTVIWNRYTGRPVYNAIVWQCRRTADICEQLKAKGMDKYINENTGLIIDAYFSATKIKWILDNVEGAKEAADRGDLLFGTIDTWIIWNLTRGRVHVTDYSNASRTMLYNIKELKWDERILNELGIPMSMLPQVKNSSEVYGYTDKKDFGFKIPISGAAGDQQAALFGQVCFNPGMAKITYGTGCFMLMNTGDKPVVSKNGLLTTIAWGINNHISYALEGSIFVAGAAIQWLRDEMRIIRTAGESETMAMSVTDTKGVYFVPAFVGIGAPYWDMYARGTITGLTRGARAEHIVRAALEAIAYQTKDILDSMEMDSGISLEKLQVDGGASENNFLMQFQSDILNVNIERPENRETTAVGAAYLAGLAVGFYNDLNDIIEKRKIDLTFESFMEKEKREELYLGWKKAVRTSLEKEN